MDRRTIALSFLPVPLLAVVMSVVHATVSPSAYYEPQWLIVIGNTVFVGAICGAIAYIAARNYHATGRIQILLLGCGVLTFGIGGVAAAAVRSIPAAGANLNVTIYNVGALAGAVFHFAAAFMLLAGVSPVFGSSRKERWLLLGYSGSLCFMTALILASLNGATPPFFVQGVGPTGVRQIVLGAADLLFVFSFVIFVGTYLRSGEVFLYWYACALALTAISLTAFFLQRSVGSPVGWAGRVSQYVGGLYFLVSLLAAARTAQRRHTSFDNVLTASLSGIEETFRALAENAPDAIRRFDRDLRHLYVNAAGLRLLGRPASAVFGRRLDEVGLSAAQCEAWKERILRVFETGERTEVEDDVTTPEGIEFFQSQLVGEYGPDGRVANVLVVSRNLTNWKRTQAALLESEERFRSMADGAPVIIWVTDVHGQNRFVNRAYSEFLGIPSEALSDYAWQPLLHPDDAAGYISAFMRAVRDRAPFRAEMRVRRVDGEWRWLASSAEPRFSPSGEFLGHAGISPDVTDRKRAEEALRDADRRKDEFLAVLSHELRNPLASIRFALPLVDRARLSEMAVRALSVIERQAGYLTRLVDDLLDVSRITRGKIELRRQPVTLSAIVNAAVEAASPAISNGGHVLTLAVDEGPAWVDVDLARLSQVITNLLNNSAKYTPPGGHITVGAHQVNGTGIISVLDDGIGIPADALASIFEMFHRVEAAGAAQGGLGIGLALAKQLVEMHGGTIEAHSAGLGQGAEFTVRLPLVAAPSSTESSAVSGRGATPPDRLKVLLVEDNADVLDMLSAVVRGLGHDVRTAKDGATGIALALSFNPDVVLLDLGLPGLSGIDVARELRRRPECRQLQIVALTGWGDADYRRQTESAGFDRYLTKPADPVLIEELLDEFALRRQPS